MNISRPGDLGLRVKGPYPSRMLGCRMLRDRYHWSRIAILSLLVLGLLALPGASHALWPLVWELGTEKNYLGPLITSETVGEASRLTVRPILFSYDPAGETYDFIYPLGRSTKEKSYFIPLYMRFESEEKSETAFFPCFFGRNKDKEYGGCFPFYGKLYGRLGRDEMGFFLWPLYSYTVDKGATKTNLLWPFFATYSGKEEGFKAWPLYGTHNREGESKSTFFLWPIFLSKQTDLDTDDPKDTFYAVPFYMRSTSPTVTSYTVMWPFFSYFRTPHMTKISAPWPLYTKTEGGDEQGVSSFPFYHHHETEDSSTTYVAWPLYKESLRPNMSEKRYYLLSRHIEDDRGTFLNIWPFFEYRQSEEQAAFFFPSIIPYRSAAFDRIARPLITLYEYRRKGDLQLTNLLYGLYTKEKKGESWKRRLAFLFELTKEPEGYGFELLSGLFGVNPHKVTLLFIPIKRTRSAGETTVTSDQLPVSSEQ